MLRLFVEDLLDNISMVICEVVSVYYVVYHEPGSGLLRQFVEVQ